jgi:hypothetical protein
VRSSLRIGFLNAGGGLQRAQCGPQDKFQRSRRIMASLKNAEMAGGRFNIIAFCEARQSTESVGLLVGDRIAYRHPAPAWDLGAGLEIHVDPALPPPTEILQPYLELEGRQDLIRQFEGRFVVYQFNLQEHVLLFAVFYGIAAGGQAAGRLLQAAHRSIRDLYRVACHRHKKQEVVVCMVGDFNAFPFWANSSMYKGTGNLAKVCERGESPECNDRTSSPDHPGPSFPSTLF